MAFKLNQRAYFMSITFTNTKMNIKLRLFCFFLSASVSLNSFAQEEPLKSKWINSLKIDGDIKDWGDTLKYYLKDQGFKYSIANDAEYLYVSIQVPNTVQQLKAIYSGFSITVNKGKKDKEGATVIFPIPDIAALRSMNAKEDYEKTKNRREAGLNMVRSIYVLGFKDIVNGQISLENSYGIKTAIKLDSADVLTYEAAIRLSQLQIDQDVPFALNLRINEIITSRYTDPGSMMGSYGNPYYGRSPYGRDPYGRSRPRSGITTKVMPGVWNLIELAKPH